MLKGVRVAEGAEDVDARFADVELVGDCGVDEVKPVRRFAERDSARGGKLVCSGEDNALAVWVDLDGGAVADQVGDREERILEGGDGVDLV